MDTQFLDHSSSWILIHTHIGHNHPPNPNVKPWKRHIDPKAGPILAPGVVLDANIKTTTQSTANVTSNLSKKPASTPEGSICRLINHPEPHVEIQTLITTTTTESLKPKNNFELPDANARLPETLHVTTATPLYYDIKADLKTLETLDSTISKLRGELCAMAPHRRQAVLMKIQTIISNERMVNNEHKLPMSFLPEPPEPNLLYNLVNETPMSPYISPVPADWEELSVKSLIEDFCGPSEATTSTFNFEDLIISQPSLDDANNRLKSKLLLPPTSPPTTTLENQTNEPPLSETQHLAQDIHYPNQIALLQPEASVTSPTPHPVPLLGTLLPPTPSPWVTRKCAREAALLHKPSVINPNLRALLAKYRLHSWLEPFVIDVQEVKADGHCGFRAIAICIGESQDKWPSIRQRIADTATSIDDDRLLPENWDDAITRLITNKPNVLTDQQHWLGMPSWGGVIATTFDRPVLYYEPDTYSQMVFPYFTAHNLNPPIVLPSPTDFTKPNFPAPRPCATWRQFHKNEASSWFDLWKPLIEYHADYLKGLNKRRRQKKRYLYSH
ncbi:uncharacterized protein MELLADRAFT_59596 [Melampsora larici-populina 98AG31]|uniref:OTU domain-containing protein n=1 Tax=Melampsora larici-populina (strain 98AG31 / pathotype 3-4-7) TaxID=747676 RepID=F4R836_MELLP|nr:uncharacterized protein MELLADRAFT_59596 [Melampsora larici-populina 98AG31]EGG11685.1 hypothetical protein MELLADRAFT_59596 [Melampsora larici-populina 98AG31]